MIQLNFGYPLLTYYCQFKMIPGLFVPLHFRSRGRKDHRENFRSCGTFVPRERRFQELSFRGTFAPRGTFVPQE